VVYAAKSGHAESGTNPRGLGKYIVITHPDGSRSVYGHLKDWLIDSEEWVRQGQVIGLVGKSGNANLVALEPHLHFEIWKDGKTVDPLRGCFKRTYQARGKVRVER
jgi:murein DD-endopeptidase MepM/ murein hydrolase activator NlpD